MTKRRAFPRDAAVRWRDDTGWEFRCSTCKGQSFWPLTEEFWNPSRNMRRCRACLRAYDAKRAVELRRRSPEAREKHRAGVRAYHDYVTSTLTPAVIEWRRAQSREASRRYRERKRAEARAA